MKHVQRIARTLQSSKNSIARLTFAPYLHRLYNFLLGSPPFGLRTAVKWRRSPHDVMDQSFISRVTPHVSIGGVDDVQFTSGVMDCLNRVEVEIAPANRTLAQSKMLLRHSHRSHPLLV
jgi:hypothetical protein